MLRLEGLTLAAGESRLVDDLSLTLPEGQITALIGPSGCGKSSVVKWLAGVPGQGIRAEGQARLGERSLRLPDAGIIAYQPQQDALFPWATIAENAALGLRRRGLSRQAARARVLPLFAPFGLSGTEALFPRQLSGGMRQRAAFLRTIVQDTPFVLLDEPFSALDAVTRLRMQDWLCARLTERPRGVLMVTHDLHEATQMADRLLVMAGPPGRIRAEIPLATPRARRSEAALAEIRTHLKSLLMED